MNRRQNEEGQQRNRYRAVTAGIFLCIVLGMALFYNLDFRGKVEKENEKRLEDATIYIINHLSSVMRGTQNILKTSATAIGSMETMEERLQYLKKIADQNAFSFMGYAGFDGILYATDPLAEGNISGKTYYQAALKGESMVTGLVKEAVSETESQGKKGFLVTVPADELKQGGVLVAMIDETKLKALLFLDNAPKEMKMYVIDRNGDKVVAFNNKLNEALFTELEQYDIEKGVSPEDIKNDIILGDSNLISMQDGDDRIYMKYAPLMFNDWTVVIMVPKSYFAWNRLPLEAQFICCVIILTVVTLTAGGGLGFYFRKKRKKLEQKPVMAVPPAELPGLEPKQDKKAEAAVKREQVDFNLGLRRLGTKDVYKRILGTYIRSTEEKLGQLKDWFDEDKERFLIEVHGLKSASASIGAIEFSERARGLELLCRQNDFEKVKEGLESFLEQGNEVLASIKVYMADAPGNITMLRDADTESGRNVRRRNAAEGDPDKERKHIVVVDDSPVNLEVAENVLIEEYRLTKLTSGEELLEYLETEKPDLILLDILMPGMNGYEALRELRANLQWRDIPVIFLTGQKDVSSEREGFRLGAKDFITKPFDNIVMLARIHSQLELREYQTKLEGMVQEKAYEVENLQHVMTVSWAEVIESRDGTTGSHVRNTTKYYQAFLRLLCKSPVYHEAITQENISDLLRASALHDIGKIGISDLVLKKPDSLDAGEFDYMKRHTRIGAEMIQKIIDNTHPDRFLLYAYDMALYHHERWDGTGYPCGLKGNEIPLYVQALSIADVFDALTAIRPYKRAFAFEEAIEIMQEDRGKFYNPQLFDLFYENRQLMRDVLNEKESE